MRLLLYVQGDRDDALPATDQHECADLVNPFSSCVSNIVRRYPYVKCCLMIEK